MTNTLRITELDDIIIYKESNFGPKIISKSKEFFYELKMQKKIIKGEFEDNKWKCDTDIKKVTISFEFDKKEYALHIGREFGISYEKMILMIKCFTLYRTGEYIFDSIAGDIVNVIKTFLCQYKEKEYIVPSTDLFRIGDFLIFIGTPEEEAKRILSNIKKVKQQKCDCRELSTLMNYLVIENEITEMFEGEKDLDKDIFIKYFPIYFWVKITFVLPLRATEMLVTPLDCVEIKENEVVLRVRRSNLKVGYKRVYYEVEKDYSIFEYRLKNIIQKQVFEITLKYVDLTKEHKRRFLFDFGFRNSNEMFSLGEFNNLLKEFIDERIINNDKYEFAKRVSGIDRFDYVTAGDSRPIAMSNLFFNDASLDICRQLANHLNVSTSEGYINNVSKTLFCSSIIRMQRWINKKSLTDKISPNGLIYKNRFGCTNPRVKVDESYIEDCTGHFEDCFGCQWYDPSEAEIMEYMKTRRKKLEQNISRMRKIIKSVNIIKGRDIDVDELFLNVHSSCVRYKESTDVYVEREAQKWVEEQNIKKTCC